MKRERGANCVGEAAGCHGIVEILNDERKIVDGERYGRAQQKNQGERESQCEGQGQAVAPDLRQFFSRLCPNAPHRLPLCRLFALLLGLLNDDDEDVLE